MMPNGSQLTLMARLIRRFGRRGLILISIGLGFAFFGLSIIFLPPRDRFSRPGPSPLDWADSNLWGWVWFICGVAALVVSLRKKKSADVIGYTAAYIPPAVWTFFYIYSFLVHTATGGEYGEPFAWTAAIIWADFTFLIRVCAGWDDPVDAPYIGNRAHDT